MTKQYEYQKKYLASHPEQRRKWSKNNIKRRIKKMLGDKCFICGFDRLTHLHHRYKKSSSSDVAIKKHKNYLLLCPNHHDLLHGDLLTEKEILKIKQYYTTTEFYINFSKNLKDIQKTTLTKDL